MPIPFVFVQRENRPQGPQYITAPDNQFEALLPLSIGWQEAPDPIRQSPFFAENNKIKPDAHMRVTSHLGLGSWANWEDVTFHIGKLVGYLKTPTYAGAQLPSVYRANIQPGGSTTYGSLYEVPSPSVVAAGPAYTASGFQGEFDGYPY